MKDRVVCSAAATQRPDEITDRQETSTVLWLLMAWLGRQEPKQRRTQASCWDRSFLRGAAEHVRSATDSSCPPGRHLVVEIPHSKRTTGHRGTLSVEGPQGGLCISCALTLWQHPEGAHGDSCLL